MTSIVLAGGKSSRLGRDKAFETLGGKNLIGHVIHSLAPLSSEVIVVTAQDEKSLQIPHHFSIRKAVDLYPGCGPLAGIHSGLVSASSFYSLVVACDMPFLDQSLLQYLINLAHGFDVVMPSVEGLMEPLHAVYSKDCLPHIERILKDGGRSVKDVLHQVNVRYVEREEIERFDPTHLSFLNMNTDIDLENARALFNGEYVREVLS